MGQAAGTAAVQSIKTGQPAHDKWNHLGVHSLCLVVYKQIVQIKMVLYIVTQYHRPIFTWRNHEMILK